MEEAIQNALNPDTQIRNSAEVYLRNLEATPGFIWNLLQIFASASNETLKLASIMLARSAIIRQWHIPKSKLRPAPVPEEEKVSIKSFLIQNTLLTPEPNPKYFEYLSLCIGAITKYSFYEQWSELQEYFVNKSNQLRENEIKVLKTIIKIQIKRRIKIRQFKDWASVLYPNLKEIWKQKQGKDLEKIILRFLTVIKDPEMVMTLLLKCKSMISGQNNEEDLKAMLKALNLVENSHPDSFEGTILNEYLEINYFLVMKLDSHDPSHSPLLRQVVHNLREIILTNEVATEVLKPFSLNLLQKCFESFKSDEYWEAWADGDFTKLLEIKESHEEVYLAKLLVCILRVYPSLMASVHEICVNLCTLPFPDSHAGLVVLALVPKAFEESLESSGLSFEKVLQVISQVNVEGFHKKVIFRDVLIIIRNWIQPTTDLFSVYSTLLQIRNSEVTDFVIIYECCLMLKKLLSLNLPPELSVSIINTFGKDIIGILKHFNVPEMVWNVISVVSLLIDKSAAQHITELLQIFQLAGLNDLLRTRTEMIVLALIEMLEGLIRIYPDESLIIQSTAFFLSHQLINPVNERVIYLWHFFIANIEAKYVYLEYIDPLLSHFSGFASDQRGIAIKILEEYLLFYTTCKRNITETLAFIQQYCIPISNLTGEIEHDSLSLAMLVSVSIVDLSIIQCLLPKFCYYLKLEKTGSGSILCLVASVCMVNKLLINHSEMIGFIDVYDWISAMRKLNSSNQKKLGCATILKNFENIQINNTEIADNVFELTVPLVENFILTVNEKKEENLRSGRITCSQLCPSIRKLNYMNEDKDVNTNLFLSFKQAMNGENGRAFRNFLNQGKIERIQEILKNNHNRSFSK